MKRLFCILLSLTMLLTLCLSASAYSLWETDQPGVTVNPVTVDEAVAQYKEQVDKNAETRRYYFQMPDGIHGYRDENGKVAESWYNEYSQGAGIYWWGNVPAAPDGWTGYRANVADAEQHIYYADVPVQIESIIWDNGVDGRELSNADQTKAKCTIDISCTDIEPGDIDTMPEGAQSLDNCIVVVDPNVYTAVLQPYTNHFVYFYYGDGCYGEYATDSASFTDVDHNCCNPDHFDKDGKHVGYHHSTLRGDYDEDDEVTVLDATRAQRILADLDVRPSDDFLASVDADGDGELTITDATRIQRVIAGLCNWDGIVPDEYELPLVRG
ncbi:MAG: dockerin type I repeat-containing protein [Ruminococcus sp.]|nr:dockerin type I repeat-containing protein [Ruminococcus sp.]